MASAEPNPPAARRPASKWVILLAAWVIGLAVWAVYIGVIVVLIARWLGVSPPISRSP
jgi:hypothetical protein